MRILRREIYKSTQLLKQKGIGEHRRIINKSHLSFHISEIEEHSEIVTNQTSVLAKE